MNGSYPRAGRRLFVGFAVLGLGAAACSADTNDDADSPASSATEPSMPAPDGPAGEVEAVFNKYWDAVVRAQNGQSDDPGELFEGIAVDEAIDQNVGVADRYARNGIVRVGRPIVSDVDVTIDGESGHVSACIDESEWLATVEGGATLPPQDDQLSAHPVTFEVVRSGDSWLIGNPIEAEGTITC